MKKIKTAKIAVVALLAAFAIGAGTAGAMTLTAAAALTIQTQPTVNAPTLTTDSENVSYQWYRMDKTFKAKVSSPIAEPISDTEIGAVFDNAATIETDGVWSNKDGSTFIVFFSVKEGDEVTVTPSVPLEEDASFGFTNYGHTLSGGDWTFDEATGAYSTKASFNMPNVHLFCPKGINSTPNSYTISVTREVDGESKTYSVVDVLGQDIDGVRFINTNGSTENDIFFLDYTGLFASVSEGEWYSFETEDGVLIEWDSIDTDQDVLSYLNDGSIYVNESTEYIKIGAKNNVGATRITLYTLTETLLESETEATLKNPQVNEIYVCKVTDGAETVTSDLISYRPFIISQPTVEAPTVEASVESLVTAYQWYQVTEEGRTAIEGETNATLGLYEIGTYECDVTWGEGDGAYTQTSQSFTYVQRIAKNPTVGNPTLAMTFPDEVTYQWYTAERNAKTVVDEVTDEESEIESYLIWSGACENGVWSGYLEGEWYGYINIAVHLEIGETLAVKMSEGEANVYGYANGEESGTGYSEGDAFAYESGVYCYTNNQAEKLYVDFYVREMTEAQTARITIEKPSLKEAVEGETGATMQNTVYGESYACVATSKTDSEKKYVSWLVEMNGAIVTQPTGKEPTVTVNYPEKATYQWYMAEKNAKTVVFEAVDMVSERQVADYWYGTCENGVWNGYFEDEGSGSINIAVHLEIGETLAVKPSEGEVNVFGYIYGEESGTEYNDHEEFAYENGVYFYTNNQVETVYIDFYVSDMTEMQTVTITAGEYVKIGDAIEGQTSATLTKHEVGGYVCKVTFENGETVMSDKITITEEDIEHSYDTYTDITEETHAKVCICGDKTDAEAHEFGDWQVTKEATVEETGEKERVCACGEKETEEIAKLTPPPADETSSATEDSDNDDTMSKDDAGVDNDGKPTMQMPSCFSGIGGGFAGLAMIGASVAVLLKKKED